MKLEELLKCQIQEWYPSFKPHSIKTLIHPIPDAFLQYLLRDDGPFLLPASSSPSADPFPVLYSSSSVIPDDDSLFPPGAQSDSNSDDDDASDAPEPPSFPDFEAQVRGSITALGGAVFPKLNWSSPKDAASMGVAGSLKCGSFSEIALLLKSSDSITHDLCHALSSCSDATESASAPGPTFYLALRKWYDSIRPEMEFRCFVRGRRLIGLSQREVTTFYPVLVERKGELSAIIASFFKEVVLPTFELNDFTFDVYVARDGRVKVLDFNPWGAYTLPLLFEWEELENKEFRCGNEEGFAFRIVENRQGVRPGLKTAVPFDYLDTGEGSGWDQFFQRASEEWQRKIQSPEAGA